MRELASSLESILSKHDEESKNMAEIALRIVRNVATSNVAEDTSQLVIHLRAINSEVSDNERIVKLLREEVEKIR